MELYSREISPYAARVRASFLAKQLDVRIIDSPDVGSAEFAKHNPLRRVPVLVLDDGTSLPESDTIVEYLEDAYPQRPLRPADAVARARVRLIARTAELYVFPALLPIFPARASGDTKKIDELFDKVDATLQQLESFMDERSSSWHAWGRQLTMADCALAPFLFYVQSIGMSCGKTPLAKHAHLQKFWDGAQAEPTLSTVIGQIARAMAARQGAKQ